MRTWDRELVSAIAELRRLPIVLRSMIFGLLIGAVVGGIVGLVVGVYAYVPTAWFAIFEVGIPAGLFGGLLGAIVGLILCAYGKAFRRSTR